MKIKLDIVSAERVVFSGDVDIIIAPGHSGQLGILPEHTPLMTILTAGELIARQGSEEYIMSISGGFLEVMPDRVIVLADAAERAEEIDIARAEAARKKAQEQLSHPASKSEAIMAEAALRRALARIEVAERRRKRKKA
ncbi:MAG TPA: F0F1 ATP synthase subunit epsilon [Dehalococcoidales bacterium]|nr:F0F1 ATP synthase subunit epsilon [Dehalococcoidales bacterium]